MIIVVKLKLFILTQFGGNRMLGVFWLTTDCNMKCIYCYEGNEKKKMYMNEETIDKAIEFLMTRAKELKDKRMNIEFHGGEPLLAYKSMESIVYKLRAKCDMEEIELRFGCTTNATLLNENRLAFISKEIVVGIIDTGLDTKCKYFLRTNYEACSVKQDGNVSLLKSDYEDKNGHGTACASIIINECPNVEFFIINAFGESGKTNLVAIEKALKILKESRLNIKINYMTVSRYDMLTVGTLTKFFKESGREYFEKV